MDVQRIVKRTYKAVVVILSIVLISGVLFFYFEAGHQGEPISLFDSIYWAVVTMTTVGYGDYTPVTTGGRVMFIVLGSSGVVLWGYLASVVMSLVVESNLAGVFGLNKCRYDNHFVLCGWTPVSKIALEELMTEERKIAIVSNNQDDIPKIKRKAEGKDVFPLYGDPSNMDILEQAGVPSANVVLLCLDDDSENLITALHVKEMNEDARVIVKTERSELKETMEIAGVTFVTTPFELSGRLIASASFEPDVAHLIEDITTATEGYDIREYVLPEELQGTVRELSDMIRKKTNATLLSVVKKKKTSKGVEWKQETNPPPDLKVKKGDSILLLGDQKEFEKVEELFGTSQGR
ncbi:MAG: NAD-binding protein [Candidatus Thermoplasmatota archaeon]|nr:NAD-binding protein [Candidatus Thermoplasmatota archaeon]